MRTLTLHSNNIGRGSLILVNPSHSIRCEAAKDYIKGFPYNGIHLEFYSAKRDFEIYYVPIFPDRLVDIKIPVFYS